ncbi:MAG: flagellar biosynthetic protein FliR [Bryobacteraceae bacterium]
MSLPTLYGFLLVLARVSGVIVFVPLPGMTSTPEVAKIVLALALTFALIEVWPTPNANEISFGSLAGSVAAEFSFGLMVGVAVSFLFEGMQLAAQMIGLQAGYSYASTIDPSTQADSGILQILTQLAAGFVFFALGLDRQVIRVLAYSLEKVPAGSYFSRASVTSTIVQLGSAVFLTGLRLAMPVVSLLLLIDISFAIFAKVHTQLQLLSLSFAAKMLAGLALLATGLTVFPLVAQKAASHTFETLFRLLSR